MPGTRRASALYHRLLIWLCRNMNTNTFQKLTIGKDIRFKSYTALVNASFKTYLSWYFLSITCYVRSDWRKRYVSKPTRLRTQIQRWRQNLLRKVGRNTIGRIALPNN